MGNSPLECVSAFCGSTFMSAPQDIRKTTLRIPGRKPTSQTLRKCESADYVSYSNSGRKGSVADLRKSSSLEYAKCPSIDLKLTTSTLRKQTSIEEKETSALRKGSSSSPDKGLSFSGSTEQSIQRSNSNPMESKPVDQNSFKIIQV